MKTAVKEMVNHYYAAGREVFSRRLPVAYRICDRHKPVVKFILAGGMATGTNLALLFIFHGLLKLELLLATSAAFVLSFLVSFTLQKFWTFRDNGRKKIVSQLFAYMGNAVIGLVLNGYLMYLLVEEYTVWYLLAQIIASLTIAFWNFLAYKFIIFKINKHEIISQ